MGVCVFGVWKKEKKVWGERKAGFMWGEEGDGMGADSAGGWWRVGLASG